jgi:hypothetical protein
MRLDAKPVPERAFQDELCKAALGGKGRARRWNEMASWPSIGQDIILSYGESRVAGSSWVLLEVGYA